MAVGLGRLLATNRRHNITINRTYSLGRSYDEKGRVTSQTFADGKIAAWTYDERDIVTNVSYEGVQMLAQTHDEIYRLTGQAFQNGLDRNITYGRSDNLRTADKVLDGSSAIPELDFSYQYAPDKNVLSQNQFGGMFADLSFTASYDAGNRVASWNRANNYAGARQTQSWNYDDAGNWNFTTIDGATESRLHTPSDEMYRKSGENVAYDPRGDQTVNRADNLVYDWDLDNRIYRVRSIGGSFDYINYRYDALGRRITRQQGTDKEILLWWGNTEQSEHEHRAGQATIQNDLQANPSEQALNTIFARAVEGSKFEVQFFHKNYLDHVMAVSDDQGDLLEHYRYTAFGEPEIYDDLGTKLATTAIDNDILWNVRRYDPQSGLYMYLYRHYHAINGRWPSRDPIGEEGGINLYAFVGKDGVNKWDYLGLEEDITVEGEFVMEANWREIESGWFDGGVEFDVGFPMGVSMGTTTSSGFKQDGPVTTEQKSGEQPQEVDPPEGYRWKDDAWVHKTVQGQKRMTMESTRMTWWQLAPAFGTTSRIYRQKTTIYWKRIAECIEDEE